MNEHMTVGQQIKRYRMASGMNSMDLAERAGVSRGYLSEIENGKKNDPSVHIVARIAGTLGVTVDELMTTQPPPVACKHWSVQWSDQPGGSIECMSCGKQMSSAPLAELRRFIQATNVFEGQMRGAVLDEITYFARERGITLEDQP